jgi:hypothetical protein
MKKVILTMSLVLAVVVLLVPQGHAYDLSINNTSRLSGYYTGSGGEFTIGFNSPPSWVGAGYVAGVTKGVPGSLGSDFIQTFCLETGEVTPGVGANINNNAVQGGVGPAGDPISKGTAWLYFEFAQGKLSDYTYAASGVGVDGFTRAQDAGILQNTIWYLEGEAGAPSNNKFLTKAETYFATDLAGIMQDNYSNGIYAVSGVKAMNEYSATGEYRQDHLILVPEPFTLIFLGVCLVGAGVASRKFNG